MADELARRRARLAALDAELARLQAQHEVLMNAFKFEAAQALVGPIATVENERAALAAGLPPVAVPQPAPYAVARRRRRR